ncbi:NADP-dependent oxidoreductase [Sphingobium estronivorans]|uniref:NADP-dependent oxidoreductase n=1 Tax=Sphingobium estronivorans TaxID=1577690 RepID=UPI001F07B0EF|nr:NADP-dependent oxidoreductase [Sphingobium estronivorans]
MVLDQFGGPDVLRLGEIERPRPAPGNVVVQVAFAGVNPADWKVREGWLSSFLTYGFPFVLGFDAAGIVAEIGEGVSGLAVGDRVVVACNQGRGERGSYADYVASDVERVVKLPDHLSLRDAAALPTAGMTAWEAVFDVGGVASGQKVLVNGGAGGTGSYAIQLAKVAGAQVAATCGPHNLDYVRGLGADLAIDYRQGGVLDAVRAWAPDGVDLVIDTVGQGSLLDAVEMVKRGGLIVPITTLIANEPMADAARAEALGVKLAVASSTFPNQERQLKALVDTLARGVIRTPDIHVMPLEAAAQAHEQVAAGHVRGKILLDVDSALDR